MQKNYIDVWEMNIRNSYRALLAGAVLAFAYPAYRSATAEEPVNKTEVVQAAPEKAPGCKIEGPVVASQTSTQNDTQTVIKPDAKPEAPKKISPSEFSEHKIAQYLEQRRGRELASRGGAVRDRYFTAINANASAYTLMECGKSPGSRNYGRTSTGARATKGETIAVDPRKIPYGTTVYISAFDPENPEFKKLSSGLQNYLAANGYDGFFTAQDCGGVVRGYNIDVFFGDNERSQALQFGRRNLTAYIIK
jgi:3D (Asp-Asp-Asp) domain-containing protein